MTLDNRLIVALVILAMAIGLTAMQACGLNVSKDVIDFMYGSAVTAIVGFYFTASADKAPQSPVQTPPASPSVTVAATDEVARRPSADAEGSQTSPGQSGAEPKPGA